MNEGENFLKAKYNLQNAPEVESALKRHGKQVKRVSGETIKIPQKPIERIQGYLDRFQEIIRRESPTEVSKGVSALKQILCKKFVIKPGNVPEAAFLLEQRIAREQGHGDIEITDEFRKRKTEEIVNNQTQSLNRWIDYLFSTDANYEDWAKYWAFRSVLEMGKIEKTEDKKGRETASFGKRRKDTVASFPPLNERALAETISVLRSRLKEKSKPKDEQKPVKNKSIKLDDLEFQELLSTENFSRIYAQFLIEMPEYSKEGLQEIRGKWVKYEQDSDAISLVQSLEGYPLEWCTAAYDTAQTQLQGGDFYVYYSLDQHGEPKVPRVAIRMELGKIAEVRGIAPDQQVDPYIAPVIEEKMKEFPDGKKYEKKSRDMKLLTEIENRVKAKQKLGREELIFLYEVESKIEGFGYHRDPRIDEIIKQRNLAEDTPVILGCEPNQVARSKEEINSDTTVYIGPFFPGIFNLNIDQIYGNFPGRRVKKEVLDIGEPNSPKLITLVTIQDRAIGISVNEVHTRAKELGLDYLPMEAFPILKERYKDVPNEEQPHIGFWLIKADGKRVATARTGAGRDGFPELENERMYLVS